MKTRTLLPAALLALAFVAQSAVAQSANNSGSSGFVSPLSKVLPPHSRTKVGAGKPGHDAVSMGYAKTKTYKIASADYPGADMSVVFDENTTTILGATQFGNDATGFTLKSNNYQLLSIPGSTISEPTAINTAGEIVGVYVDATGFEHGFLDNAGVITNIDDPSGVPGSTNLFDINDSGEMVGFYQDVNLTTHGLFTADGITFNTLDFPGGGATTATAVNLVGEIVGIWTDKNGATHGFLYNAGVFNSFDFPLAKSTSALGINDSGEIAGTFTDAGGVQHGFIYSGTQFSQIDVAGAAQTQITRLKNTGNITGVYIDSTDEMHGFTGH
jgi:probable HAF family extracellular repeat protein